MNIKLNLYKGFKEDKRISIEGYARFLEFYIKKDNNNKNISLSSYKPKQLMSRYFPNKINMRFARYIEYPLQIRTIHKKYDIHHIIEEGYAHLIDLPLDNKRTIVTVHDLIPLLSWKGIIHNLNYPHRPRLAEYSFNSLKRAAHIITISQNTKKDLIKFCGVKKKNISVIYNGCGKLFKPLPKKHKEILRKSKFNFPTDSFLILIIGHQSYKNHETALKVLSQLRLKKKNIYIVRLGRKNESWSKLKKYYSLDKYIIELNWLKPNEVSELYNSVDCLLFPSWYEGFGRPPLEAMASGVPVVASNVASIPEVVGKAGLLYDPNDVKGMTKGINLILKNKKVRNQMIKKGIKQSFLFSWEKNVEETIKVYKSIISRNYETQ